MSFDIDEVKARLLAIKAKLLVSIDKTLSIEEMEKSKETDVSGSYGATFSKFHEALVRAIDDVQEEKEKARE